MAHHFPELGITSMRPSGDVQKCPPKMILAWVTENGPDILLATSLAAILLLTTHGSLSVEGRFTGMKVCHRGGGFPIGDP